MNKRLFYRRVMDSTNVQAMILGNRGAEHGTVVSCDIQTMGKGRMNREWTSPEGGLWFSLILRPDIHIKSSPMLTIVMALAIVKAIRLLDLDAGIKWPNDIVVNGKKICGILTELQPGDNYFVVIGCGVNVNIDTFAPELSDKATSIFIEKGQECDRERLMDRILDFFEEYYNIFVKDGNLKRLTGIYNELLVHKDKEVFVEDGTSKQVYLVRGIEETGELICEKDGTEERLVSGEIHVRGIYGYV